MIGHFFSQHYCACEEHVVYWRGIGAFFSQGVPIYMCDPLFNLVRSPGAPFSAWALCSCSPCAGKDATCTPIEMLQVACPARASFEAVP